MSGGTAQGSANGPKKIFGRENINWQGPQKAASNNLQSAENSSAQSASGDFSSSHDTLSKGIEKYLLESSGLNIARDVAVSIAVSGHILKTGVSYNSEDFSDISQKYEEKFNQFSQTEQGKQVIAEDLGEALSVYGVIDEKAIANAGKAVLDKGKMEDFVEDNGFNSTVESFEDYIKQEEEQKNNQEAFDSLVNNSFVPPEEFEEELENLRLQDAQDRGYDSIEDYEDDLHMAEDDYAEGEGFEVIRDQATLAALNQLSTGKSRNSSETNEEAAYYRELFDDYYDEGFNSETVLNSALSANSSFEVVNVRDGETEINKEQEAQWAASYELDYVREGFINYARKHPYEG